MVCSAMVLFVNANGRDNHQTATTSLRQNYPASEDFCSLSAIFTQSTFKKTGLMLSTRRMLHEIVAKPYESVERAT